MTMLIPAGPDALLSGSQVAKYAGVTRQAVSNWRTRGHIAPAGLDQRRRPLYRKADVWAVLQRATAPRPAGRLDRKSITAVYSLPVADLCLHPASSPGPQALDPCAPGAPHVRAATASTAPVALPPVARASSRQGRPPETACRCPDPTTEGGLS